MDTTSPIKFEELKNEERFKRLERKLKLAYIKQMERVKASGDKGYNSNSPTWPSLSTINPDGMDTSCTNGPSLHVSRVESEVVSYSTNLRKMLPGHKISHIERKPMATSSVKKFPLNEIDSDQAIMPPPSANIIFSNRKVIKSASKQSVEDQQSKQRDSETCSSSHKTSLNSSMTFEENNTSFNQCDSADSKSYRIFSRWRVLINDQEQLIIKGTLECGKIARSKPVIQRFTNTKVQSIYKHIYILHGTLVDERNELPRYVQGKFHNGFPDDWENVYQLWRNYLAAGSKASFRWPTPITDSDDDLNSEITDFTYCRSKGSQNTDHPIISNSNDGSLGYHSRSQSECNQNLEKSKEERNQISNVQNINKNVNDSAHSSESKEVSTNKMEQSVESSKDSQNLISFNSSNSNLRNTSYLYEIIREDKVRTILHNLGDRNCPPQYLDKFIELIDCLRYILSYASNNSEVDNTGQISLSSEKLTEGCQKCNSSYLETQKKKSNQSDKGSSKNEDEKSKLISKPENCSENCKVTENQIQLKAACSDDDIDGNSSDSDSYMGIPHVSLSHLITNKPKRSQRYRDRKIRKDGRSIEKQNEEQIHPVENQNVKELYDSSVSITEDEYEKRLKERSDKRYLQYVCRESHEKAAIPNDVERQRANLKTMDSKNNNSKVTVPNKRPQNNSTEKSKPIIKSNDQVNLNLKLKHPLKTKNFLEHSDISIIDENSFKNQSNGNSNAVTANNQEENYNDKDSENALEHHFLTYDSEDFVDEEEANENNVKQAPTNSKNKDAKKFSEIKDKRKVENAESKKYERRSKIETEYTPVTKKRKGSIKEKTSTNEPFGSKENPKLLTSWVPCVVYNDELKKNCNLTFEGKLLNEKGLVLHRKYTTDPIRERHSAKLIETVNNEYFMLLGELSDTKHVVPKEVLRQCRTGCPTRIKEFCEQWKSLTTVLEKEGANKITNLHNASIELLAVPTSSRGRKIVPSLNFWNGERLLYKNNGVVYTPGHTSEKSQIEQSISLKKSMTLSEQQPQNNNKKEINLRVSKSSTKPSSTIDDLANLESKPRQLKKRIAQKLQYSSNDSEASEPSNKKSFRKPLDPRESNRKQGNSRTQPDESEILTKSAYNVKQREKLKTDKGNCQKNVEPNDKKLRISAKKSSEALTWTYDTGQYQDNMLSDDQSSVYIK